MEHDADYLASLADKMTLVPSRGGALFQNIQSGGRQSLTHLSKPSIRSTLKASHWQHSGYALHQKPGDSYTLPPCQQVAHKVWMRIMTFAAMPAGDCQRRSNGRLQCHCEGARMDREQGQLGGRPGSCRRCLDRHGGPQAHGRRCPWHHHGPPSRRCTAELAPLA